MKEITKKREMRLCRNCGKKTRFVSRNGHCKICMKAKLLNINTQIKLKEGPYYDKWRAKMIKVLGLE